MFYVRFEIGPFEFLKSEFKQLFCVEHPFEWWKNKNYCVESYIGSNWSLGFHLNIQFEGYDHAGPRFELYLGPIKFTAHIYDSRHWDYETNTWEIEE